jgi:site-specific recombinase XerD
MSNISTFSILFWIKKSKTKSGKAPLFARVTINRQRTEISIHRKVSILEWNPECQLSTAKTQEGKALNADLAIIKAKLLGCQSRLEARGEEVTAEKIKNEYCGKRTESKTIIQAFDFKLDRLKEEVQKNKKAPATLDKYEYTKSKVVSFLKHTQKISDKRLSEITFSFAPDFEHYLSVTLGLDNNTSMKYLSRTKSVLKMAAERGWIPGNPIAGFKCDFIERDPLRLESHELKIIYEKQFTIRRLEEARDIYLFMCYTGFAYIDTYELTEKNIFWGIDKRKWIARDRQKTDGTECVPLLDIPLQIIEKYKSHPYCLNTGKLLPVNSNQRFNAYLKEIADTCGIEKELTTHTGRHTFATTITLENDVPLETVGKMLGHRSIRSTQRYARVTKKKISNNMNELRMKLDNNNPLQKNGTY